MDEFNDILPDFDNPHVPTTSNIQTELENQNQVIENGHPEGTGNEVDQSGVHGLDQYGIHSDVNVGGGGGHNYGTGIGVGIGVGVGVGNLTGIGVGVGSRNNDQFPLPISQSQTQSHRQQSTTNTNVISQTSTPGYNESTHLIESDTINDGNEGPPHPIQVDYLGPEQHDYSQPYDIDNEPVDNQFEDRPIRKLPKSRLNPGSKSSKYTDQEKKDRQREQNRKAAERSRQRRRGEHSALEVNVATISTENAKLRERLGVLLANQAISTAPSLQNSEPSSTHIGPEQNQDLNSSMDAEQTTQNVDPLSDQTILNHDTSSASPSAPPSSQLGPDLHIDYTYFRKLQEDLRVAKMTLLEKELELTRLRRGFSGVLDENDNPKSPSQIRSQTEGDVNSSPTQLLRHTFLAHTAALTTLQAESNALNTIAENLRIEKESWTKQREAFAREIDTLRAIRAFEDPHGALRMGVEHSSMPGHADGNGGFESVENGVVDGQEDLGVGIGDEAVLGDELDVRGWMDQAIRNWDAVDHAQSIGRRASDMIEVSN